MNKAFTVTMVDAEDEENEDDPFGLFPRISRRIVSEHRRSDNTKMPANNNKVLSDQKPFKKEIFHVMTPRRRVTEDRWDYYQGKDADIYEEEHKR